MVVQRWSDERGYLMVALLVAISVMAIMMTAAMPAWHTMAQREKEAELVFRGEQMARAIGLYQRKFANAQAPSIDVLVEQKFLRKKYKDPITNDDFQVLTSGNNFPGQTGPGVQAGRQTQAGATQTAGRGATAGTTAGRAGAGGSSFASTGFGGAVGGVVGVTSKSTQKSLRLYNDRDTYNEWIFMPVAQAARAGGAGAGAGAGQGGRGADGRGGRGGDDGFRGGFGAGQGGRGGDGRGGRGDGRGGDGRGGRSGPPTGQGGRGFELPPRGRF